MADEDRNQYFKGEGIGARVHHVALVAKGGFSPRCKLSSIGTLPIP
jgi:hypothetical protein